MLTTIKFYIAAGVVALLALAYWRYDYVVKDRDKVTKELKLSQENLALEIESKEKILAEALEENANRITYLQQLEHANNEKSRLEKCIADKSCIATIRVRVPASCPVPAANKEGDTTGASTAEAELTGDAIRAYSVHASATRRVEADLNICINTLKAWQ
jgi:hypothetical protein